MESSKFKVKSSKLKKFFIFFFFSLFTFHFSLFTAFAETTIKVLIVNEAYPKIPAKDEKIEKLGSMKGDFLVMGSCHSGNIEVWKGDSGLYLINELPMEDYVKGVVMAEVGSNWEMEALKAQAVISRTYAAYQKEINGGSLYHITSSVFHQVYKGNNSDTKVAHAVAETSSEILTFNGSPIEAFYHSTSGGKTENPEDVFGKSYPYLRSVESNCEISPYWIWERGIKLAEIEKALNLSEIKEISIKSYTSTKRVKELTIVNDSGITTIKATDLRKALGWSRLPSTNFTIKQDGDSMIFEGKGYGHGVGLCQWSALQMAREGKNYKEILSFFYPGTTIQPYEGR
ncbi:MAG: SpoIID/LytB domain-containing protein [Thermodesulfovibrionales bacterium]|nr:SpoIID/LytB domain-containing protein [Thermodesulfovibrionales bacterium]